MFLLRSVTAGDAKDLFELSKTMLFINLPPDEEIIKKKIKHSVRSFKKHGGKFEDNYYIFVLEDLKTKKVIGVSMIHAQHGTETEPHFFLKVGQEHKFSKSLNTGFIHGTLKLGYDQNGPTEIGGLVLLPEFRNNPNKLGRQLSFVRFLYMAIYPEFFKEEIHSELMPPLDKEGNSPLWEAIGRRFLNMNYHEADFLSRSNKEFILSLYPSDTIYTTLLPIEARDAISKVGESSKPVKKMLEKIGFTHNNEVDPFDGGPHYRCKLKNITLVKNKLSGLLDKKSPYIATEAEEILLTLKIDKYDFSAIQTLANIKKVNGETKVILPPETYEIFKINDNLETDFILL
ncbi:MAG: arginine N-succinyltransferase [Bacteriovoracaceae bacterium]